jgi:hypothetical protein
MIARCQINRTSKFAFNSWIVRLNAGTLIGGPDA